MTTLAANPIEMLQDTLEAYHLQLQAVSDARSKADELSDAVSTAKRDLEAAQADALLAPEAAAHIDGKNAETRAQQATAYLKGHTEYQQALAAFNTWANEKRTADTALLNAADKLTALRHAVNAQTAILNYLAAVKD